MPDIDSKKESINVIPLKTNGIDPAEDKTTQNNVITKNPSLWLISSTLSFDKNHPKNPSAKTIKNVVIKMDRAPSLYIKEVIIGITNEMLKNITKILKSFNRGLKFIDLFKKHLYFIYFILIR
jgi:hypothetical protein